MASAKIVITRLDQMADNMFVADKTAGLSLFINSLPRSRRFDDRNQTRLKLLNPRFNQM